MTLTDSHRIFVANMTDGIRRDLADLLGCTPESIVALEVGFYPGKQVWTFPERDAEGQIIGITTRTWAIRVSSASTARLSTADAGSG